MSTNTRADYKQKYESLLNQLNEEKQKLNKEREDLDNQKEYLEFKKELKNVKVSRIHLLLLKKRKKLLHQKLFQLILKENRVRN